MLKDLILGLNFKIMKKTILFFFFAIGCGFCLPVTAQDNTEKINAAGSWLGKLDVSGITLRIIFNISLTGKDSLTVTLDSPDQGAKGIKIGPVKIDGNNIKIAAAMLMGEYNGTFRSDTLIEGKWKQAGNTYPLDLVKLKTAFILNRPQEPAPPYPYNSRDVIFRNEKAKINLGGTLTIPPGDGPFPAVILITGSGPQNRNEELMGHKPFLVIADYLTRHGIAVFRYDDRGVGKSEAGPAGPTSADFATDVEAALSYLMSLPSVNNKKIGLAGHSEGGLIAPIVASGNKDIAFVIALAGPGVTGEQVILRQAYDINKASGMNEKELRSNTELSRKLYTILRKQPDNLKAAEQMSSIVKKSLTKEKKSEDEIRKAMDQFKTSAATLTSPWFRYFLFTDPALFWEKVKCPVLALNGEKDLQVAADENLPAIEKAVRKGGNTNITTVSFPGLNHLFQHCKTGLPAEYGEIEETFSPEVLKLMSDWILAL
jgi:pimeloyl-ACP methyl ester carboxylesterase